MQLFHSLGLSDALPSEDVSWKEWLVSFFCSLSIKDRDVVLLTYWAIWFTRNRVVHDGVIASVPDTYTFVEVFPQGMRLRQLPQKVRGVRTKCQRFNHDDLFNISPRCGTCFHC
ncbi:hypothetical protein V6N11_023393 [Hibiscus sabdariffa]|uniref:Aminotransferase-like plant mobile domain-containing protein n=1 Tax=Hibiscus sabdariffa TaxID=183260 RepID=A0ABR2TM40_9ROSI